VEVNRVVGGREWRLLSRWNFRRAVEHGRSNKNEDDDLPWRVIPKRYPPLGWAELGVAAH
jgi:hypothetical protein